MKGAARENHPGEKNFLLELVGLKGLNCEILNLWFSFQREEHEPHLEHGPLVHRCYYFRKSAHLHLGTLLKSS